jgi:leucyl-tRNA synthetase
MAPMAPHITEELWHQVGIAKTANDSIHVHPWPKYIDTLTISDEIELVLQVNGKIVNKIMVGRGITKEKLEEIALSDDKVKSKLNGSAARKIIVVPNKLVNVVI